MSEFEIIYNEADELKDETVFLKCSSCKKTYILSARIHWLTGRDPPQVDIESLYREDE